MAKIQEIAQTIATLAKPDLKPRELVKKVRKQHPNASSKEITRAAFYAMIVAADGSRDGEAADLQEAALNLRSSESA